MKLGKILIKNFKSCRQIELDIGSIHALVGGNGTGKSSVLRALDFLFNPSVPNLDEECFWNKDTTLEIRVEATFFDFTATEVTQLGECIRPDGTFHMARTAKFGKSDADDGESDEKILIGQHYRQLVPDVEWLQADNINGEKITEWWKIKDQLEINGIRFGDQFPPEKKPKVDDWKTKAKEFVGTHRNTLPMKDVWIHNPKGYPNVLKAVLPFFVLVPAVRKVADESKGTKTSPFGKLLYSIVGAMDQKRKTDIEDKLTEVKQHMNRIGGANRDPLIKATEDELNTLLGEFFPGCDLEIEFETPTLEVLLTSPKLYVDDGFRNVVENKGHGLQRAIIFSILRRYADFMTTAAGKRARHLILAIEEPELYMHPQAQRTARSVFRKMAEAGDQVLFCTHSSLFVDVAYFDEIIRLESHFETIDGKRTAVSTAWQLTMERMIRDLVTRYPKLAGRVTADSMREKYSHAYNPRRNEGFFASKVILVEGQTEEYSLPIYADILPDSSFDPNGISVVECGGKGQMDRLYRIFNELHIPCYVMFDYDYRNKDAKIIEKSKELLKLLGEKEEAPKGTFVANCVACFPTTWEDEIKQQVENYAEIEEEAKNELGIPKDSESKPLVARYMARKLILGGAGAVPKSVQAIIAEVIKAKWTKSCLEGQS